jgi:hypothetical protein
MVASFFDQLLPVLEVDGSILIELFTDGGDAEIGRRLAEEMRLLPPGARPGYLVSGQDPRGLGRGDGDGGISQGQTVVDPRCGAAHPRSQDGQ